MKSVIGLKEGASTIFIIIIIELRTLFGIAVYCCFVLVLQLGVNGVISVKLISQQNVLGW